jgi:hypothetical protein
MALGMLEEIVRGDLQGRSRSKAAASSAITRSMPQAEALEPRWMPAAIRNLAGFLVNNLPANDDGSTAAVPLGFNINFFGVQTTTVFVNNNGNITITTPLSTFTPFGLSGNIGTPIIAPFFADVDTRAGNVLTYGQDTLCGFRVFGVNWINVGYFDTHIDRLNSFQVILIERPDTGPGNFDIEFNYDQIQWETGDASGGSGGLGGSSARVGYSNGTGAPGTFFELQGSGVNGAFLDGGINALVSNRLLASTPGRYHFFVRSGQVVEDVEGNLEVTGATKVFYPFRYIFDRTTNLYRGNLTLLNVGGRLDTVGGNACLDITLSGTIATGAFPSPVTAVFPQLPPGVRLLNESGRTASGAPYITINTNNFPRNRAVRMPLLLENPLLQHLSTFMQGFRVRVFAGQFDPSTV